MALRIVEKPLDYLCESDAWGWLPHDLMAIACYRLNEPELAKRHGRKALEIKPNDDRLVKNLRWYEQMPDSSTVTSI